MLGDTTGLHPAGRLRLYEFDNSTALVAVGVAQVVDIVWQLRHELPKNRQVKNAQNGLTVNFGGFGNNVLSFVLRRVEQ